MVDGIMTSSLVVAGMKRDIFIWKLYYCRSFEGAGDRDRIRLHPFPRLSQKDGEKPGLEANVDLVPQSLDIQSRQILSTPNFEFGNRVHTRKQGLPRKT